MQNPCLPLIWMHDTFRVYDDRILSNIRRGINKSTIKYYVTYHALGMAQLERINKFGIRGVGHAMSLHRLQRRILRRGLEFLRPRGTLVYSTCSLNPLEDEAVVVSVINDVGGIDAVEILPLPTWLVQKCQSLNGLETWLVPHPQFGKKGLDEMYQSFDDIPIEHQGGGTKEKGEKKNKKKGGQISRTMFPPATNDSLKSQLGNCGRFIPNNSLDSCLRRLKVGELGGGVETKSNSTSADDAVEQEEAPLIESSGMNEVEDTVQPSTEAESQDADSSPADSSNKRRRLD